MPVTPDPTTVMVRSAVCWCLAALPVAVVLAAVWRGAPGALGGGAGFALVTCFFALGVLAVDLLVRAVPGLAVVIAFGVYGTQLMILLLALVVLRDYADIDRGAFAFGAVAATMIWQVAHTRAFARARMPLYTLTAPKEEP